MLVMGLHYGDDGKMSYDANSEASNPPTCQNKQKINITAIIVAVLTALAGGAIGGLTYRGKALCISTVILLQGYSFH